MASNLEEIESENELEEGEIDDDEAEEEEGKILHECTRLAEDVSLRPFNKHSVSSNSRNGSLSPFRTKHESRPFGAGRRRDSQSSSRPQQYTKFMNRPFSTPFGKSCVRNGFQSSSRSSVVHSRSNFSSSSSSFGQSSRPKGKLLTLRESEIKVYENRGTIERTPQSRRAVAPHPRMSEYSSRRQRLLSTIRKRTTKPSANMHGSSYDDLLVQYKEIKSKLRDLVTEEESAPIPILNVSSDSDEVVEIKEVDKENIKSRKDSVSHSNDGDTQLQNRSKLCQSRLQQSSNKSNIVLKARNEDDEQEEEILRKIALASAQNARQKKTQYGGKAQKVQSQVERNTECNYIVLEDNYEEVSMELDSPLPSPICSNVDLSEEIKAVENHAVSELANATSDIDEDEDILRAMLLSSLTNKQLEKSTPISDTALCSEKTQTQLKQLGSKSSSLNLKQAKSLPPLMPHPPLHQPVVINLNEDSDSELELECSPSKRPLNISSIDDLLREARQVSDSKINADLMSIPQAPAPVFELPESNLREYQRLKAEIAVREQKSPLNKGSASVENDSPTTASECTSLMNGLKTCEQLLVKKRASMTIEQTAAAELEKQIERKNETLMSAELKAKTLQGQLNAAIKIADAQRQALEILKKKQVDLSSVVLAQKNENQKLEQECLSVGRKVIGESYGLPRLSNSSTVKRKPVINNAAPVFKRKVGLNKSTKNISITINNKPLKTKPINRVAHDRAKLQEMSDEIAKKLQELRMKALRVSNKSKPKPQSNSKAATSSIGQSQKRERKNSHKAKLPSRAGNLAISKPLKEPAQANNSDTVSLKTQHCNFPFDQGTIVKKMQVDLINKSPMEILDISTFAFDFHNMFMNKVPNLNVKLPYFDKYASKVPFCETFRPYKSPLLHLKAYRFSPYFRTKANQCLSWPTYSHKLKPNKVFCRFDLTGTCNDDKCSWQHQNDYTMSGTDILRDIVSYAPLLVGLSEGSSDQEYKEYIENYLDMLLTSSKDRMTQDQLCVLLVGRVNEFLGKVPPHYITFDNRVQQCSNEHDENNCSNSDSNFRRKRLKVLRRCIIDDVDPDAILDENDVRYFHGERLSDDTCESAVFSDPKNTDMWLKLAYKNLNSIGCSQELCLDLALNALSRGLEVNQNNSEVWLHYLSLYSKRSNCGDLMQLCEQAIQFAPTYEIWWKYLQYTEAYENKISLCNDMMGFIIQSLVDPAVKSHQIIETLLYCSQLNVLTGRHPQAICVLEEALGKRTTSSMSNFPLVVDHMTRSDRCLTWLCYIHLLEFRYLPNTVFNPGNSGLGKIVCKNLFILPWQTDRPMHLPVASILSLFMDALRNCVMKGQPAKVNVPVCLPLYKNLIALQLFRGRNNSAIDVCQQLMKVATLDEVWILLACVHFKIGNVDEVRKTLHTALNGPDATPRLFCFASMFELGQGNYQAARNWSCACIESLLDLPDEKAIAVLEPELTFSHILGLPLPLSPCIPELKVQSAEIIKHKSSLWLTYCIFLITQGRYLEVKETFETAIPGITDIDDLKVTWLHYLKFTLWRIAESVTKQQDFDAFTSLVLRCVTSVPCSVPLPGSGKASLDYTFYNNVVDLYEKAADPDQIIKVYERFVAMCPKNATLVLKLLDLYMSKVDYKKAQYFCQHHLDIIPSCLSLWKTAIYLALMDKPTNEIRMLYIRATDTLPYTLSLWKDFMLFELANDEADRVRDLIDKCQKLGIAINDPPGNIKTNSLTD